MNKPSFTDSPPPSPSPSPSPSPPFPYSCSPPDTPSPSPSPDISARGTGQLTIYQDNPQCVADKFSPKLDKPLLSEQDRIPYKNQPPTAIISCRPTRLPMTVTNLLDRVQSRPETMGNRHRTGVKGKK